MKLRFAPSPTGLLHVGNARVALVNWLAARQAGGQVLLRLDDTDLERSKAEYALALEEDLRWLGLDWDAMFRQSDRLGLYAAAAERLKASGRLYPCFESEEELRYKREQQLRLKDGKPFVTDSGNAIIDVTIGHIPEPRRLDGLLKSIPGVVDHGLFIDICGIILMGTDDGGTTMRKA